jgi:hypothetical protein
MRRAGIAVFFIATAAERENPEMAVELTKEAGERARWLEDDQDGFKRAQKWL